MKTQVRVITHLAHEQIVKEALERGGYPIAERTEYEPLKDICFLVDHPDIPFSLDAAALKMTVLRWLSHRLDKEIFYVVMGA